MPVIIFIFLVVIFLILFLSGSRRNRLYGVISDEAEFDFSVIRIREKIQSCRKTRQLTRVFYYALKDVKKIRRSVSNKRYITSVQQLWADYYNRSAELTPNPIKPVNATTPTLPSMEISSEV